MNTDNIWSLLILSTITLYGAARRLRKTKHIFIPDYKRGVRFVKGTFANVLGPGSYKPYSLNEQVEIVDMRPQPVFLERISFRDALQDESIVSIGGEILVCDAHLAATMVKEQIDDSLPVIREAIRSVVSRAIVDESSEFRVKTTDDITRAINSELQRLGMKISKVEIVELWSRPFLGHFRADSN